MKRLLLIFILISVPGMRAYAAAPSTNVYEIEVVVFENRLPDLEGGELWARDPDKSATADMNDAVRIGEKPAADSALSATAAALESSGRHHVLAHLRWQQSAEAKSVSKPVKVGSADGALDGALRFYSSRFLLLDVNLTLRETVSGGMSGGAGQITPAYRLTEARRVKSSETYYFDHPKFGALVRVSPVKAN
ncbi:CsiV family protein [Sulfuricaulis sp.]|uniref:CsiV family protein n=1 Tax=Sulfuricaulis sp. TaxID=2003553 RepID=UPI00355A8BE3